VCRDWLLARRNLAKMWTGRGLSQQMHRYRCRASDTTSSWAADGWFLYVVTVSQLR
jgi:hypothetical protein